MGVTVVAAGAEAPPSAPPGRLWRVVLRFLALRLADVVVYAMCASLLLLNAGAVLSVLAGRVGGARLTDAARLVVMAGVCLLPSYIVGTPLLAWRCAVAEAAKSTSSNKAPADGTSKGSSVLGNLWARTPTRWRVYFMFFLPVLAGQLIRMCSPVEGSFVDKVASLLWDGGLAGMALVQGWFAPSMAMEWTAAQRTCAGLKKNELPV